MFGLTAALYGEITLAWGVVRRSNFHSQPILHAEEAPRVLGIVMPCRGKPGGVGEPAVPLVLLALVNGIFAVTGRRVHKLPVAGAP